MRRSIEYLIIPLLLAAAAPAAAQEQTLIPPSDVSHGGYGAPAVKFTVLRGHGAVLAGGRGGWIINHTFIIGGAGYGLTSEIDSRRLGPFGERYLEFGYGGLTLEYVMNSDRLVHGSVELLLGGGSVTHRRDDDTHYGNGYGYGDDAVAVIEPGATVDVNVTTWFRASAGASYRIVTGAHRGMASDADLSAPAISLLFRFGKF